MLLFNPDRRSLSFVYCKPFSTPLYYITTLYHIPLSHATHYHTLSWKYENMKIAQTFEKYFPPMGPKWNSHYGIFFNDVIVWHETSKISSFHIFWHMKWNQKKIRTATGLNFKLWWFKSAQSQSSLLYYSILVFKLLVYCYYFFILRFYSEYVLNNTTLLN